jgi:hypothetical protein
MINNRSAAISLNKIFGVYAYGHKEAKIRVGALITILKVIFVITLMRP